MALAPSLIKGFQYRIKQGVLEDEIVTIVDNAVFPSDDDRRRKITVEMSDGSIEYVLPRLLDDTPIGIAGFAQPVAPAAVIQVAQPVAPAPAAPAEAIHIQSAPALVRAGVVNHNPITDPMDPRLDHWRPKRSVLRTYRNRIMDNGMTDVDFLLKFTDNAYRLKNEGRPRNVILKGDTQAGKTMLISVLAFKYSEKLAAEQRARGEVVTYTKPMPVFVLSGSHGITDYDIFGQTTSYTDPLTGEETLVWLPGVAELAAQIGGIFYIDEVQAISERFAISLHPMLDHRHMFVNRNKPVDKNGQKMAEVVHTPLDLWCVASANDAGYAGMGNVGEAFKNRFANVEWAYDKAVEAKLITSPTIRTIGEAMRLAREGMELSTPVGTSALEALELDVEVFGVDMALNIFVGLFEVEERGKVRDILRDRTLAEALNQEVKQRQQNAAAAAPATGTLPVFGLFDAFDDDEG